MKNEILYRGFESIPSRQGRGGTYQYVRWQDVADRMNEVFGTSWSSEVRSQDVVGENIIVRVRVTVFDSETNAFTSQEGFGGAPNDSRAEAGNPYKSAYSKALKDACKKWGLGLFLEEETGGHMTPEQLPQGYSGKEYGVPPATQTPTQQPMQPTPQLAPEAQHLAQPSTGGLPTPPGVGLPTPPATNIVQESVVLTQQEPAVPMTPPIPTAPVADPIPAPPIPQPPQSAQPAAPQQGGGLPTPTHVQLQTNDMPMSKANLVSTGEPDRISDVQKAALHGILSYKGVEYEALAREAFEANGVVKETIPSPDDLTYQEAVFVVKYGNDKFRRR